MTATHLPHAALIAEYLALASTLQPSSLASDHRRANQLAFQLAMEPPADLWRPILAAMASGRVKEKWDATFAIR